MLDKIRELRKYTYDYHYKHFPYIKEWKWYRYRKIKGVLYMELTPWLAHFLIKLRVSPNFVTFTYVISGIAGGRKRRLRPGEW